MNVHNDQHIMKNNLGDGKSVPVVFSKKNRHYGRKQAVTAVFKVKERCVPVAACASR